jgi:hypothetical protein
MLDSLALPISVGKSWPCIKKTSLSNRSLFIYPDEFSSIKSRMIRYNSKGRHIIDNLKLHHIYSLFDIESLWTNYSNTYKVDTTRANQDQQRITFLTLADVNTIPLHLPLTFAIQAIIFASIIVQYTFNGHSYRARLMKICNCQI